MNVQKRICNFYYRIIQHLIVSQIIHDERNIKVVRNTIFLSVIKMHTKISVLHYTAKRISINNRNWSSVQEENHVAREY